MRRIVLFVFALFVMNKINASTLSGVVSNRANGQPIEHANVIIKETGQGAHSNNRGYFVITNLNTGTFTLLISHVSFAGVEKEFTIKEENTNEYILIELISQAVAMDEMWIYADGTREVINTREIVISQIGRSTKQLLDVVQVAEPDIFRSILTLPGVTPIADFSSGMYIRGGSPDQNQILLDDIDVYNPTHFGGLFSTFNTDAINSVDLLKGGFPAKYGGRLSSVLDVKNRDGNRKDHQGIARLSMISLSGTLEGPWKLSNEKGSYMGSFRRSYLEMMQQFNSIIPDYYFYDGHAKINWDLGQQDRMMLSAYFGYDKLQLDAGGTDLMVGWGNNTISSQWMHIFNPQLFSQFMMATSSFKSTIEQKTSNYSFKRYNSIDDMTLKGIMSYKPNNDHFLEFGFETKYNFVDYHAQTDADISKEALPEVLVSSIMGDVYLQDSWILNPFWTFQPGVRLTNYTTLEINIPNSPSANYFRVSPRASLRRKLSVDSNISMSYGRYYQFLTCIGFEISTPMDVWMPLDGTIKPGESDHYILGYKHELTDGLGLDIEIYYKDLKNLTEYNREIEMEWDHETMTLSDALHLGKGDAKGMDLLLRTDKWGWEGFLGYTFCVTKKKIAGININPHNGQAQYFYPRHDRTHQINVVQALNMTEQFGVQIGNAELILGITYAYATGQPTSVPEKIYYDGTRYRFLHSYEDSQRLKDYSRLDVAFKMKWFKHHYVIEPYFQLINATGRKNIFSRNYYVEAEENEFEIGEIPLLKLKYRDTAQFPFIPFIGINILW